MIELRCRCGRTLRVPPSYVGRKGACPHCGEIVRLVGPGEISEGERFEAMLLVVVGPRHVGEQFRLGGTGPIEIGKLPDLPIVLRGQKVSRRHARLVRGAEGWRIEDTGSTNGVSVDHRRVAAHDLHDGDFITIGEYELKYATMEPLPPPPAAAEAASPSLAEDEVLEDAATSTTPRDDPDVESMFGGDLYELAEAEVEGEAVPLAPPVEEAPPQERLGRPAAPAAPTDADGPECPSCGQRLPSGARICLDCGINVDTGRAILISQDTDLDRIYTATENIVRYLSFIIWFGIYPIASEAFGTSKPYVVRAIGIVTTVVSLWFLFMVLSGSDRMHSLKNLMLWCGEAQPSAAELLERYRYDQENWGDRDAFIQRMEELQGEVEPADLPLAAHRALPVEQRVIGQPRWWQFLTHAFLHGGLVHLAGNMLFLFVFGSRINALIGNIATAVVYPILAMGAGLIFMISAVNETPTPMLGASGAIMGLAGMYFVLMPLPKIHMVAWYRLGLIFGFRLGMKLFAVRGFWVVLAYISLDVLATLTRQADGVAHWAHLGGFIVGIILGSAMLMTRLVNARGGDIYSALLGRHAWALIGKPHRPHAARQSSSEGA